jgi:hypothetical protein
LQIYGFVHQIGRKNQSAQMLWEDMLLCSEKAIAGEVF